MVYSNLSWVGFSCALPAYWHGAAAENVNKRTHKVNKTHTHANTRPAAPSLQDTITPPRRLFRPTSLSFSFPPSPLPLIRTGMSTSVATLGCGRGPHLAPRRLLRTHAFQKTCQIAGTSSCLIMGWAGIGCLAPISLKSGLPSWMFLTSPGFYFWVLPMPGELLPHWVVIDRASLF